MARPTIAQLENTLDEIRKTYEFDKSKTRIYLDDSGSRYKIVLTTYDTKTNTDIELQKQIDSNSRI